MKLSELKDGDIVVRANGTVRMLIGSAFKGKESYLDKSSYNEDLYTTDKNWRIRKVYRSKYCTLGDFTFADKESDFRPGNLELIYEAPPALPDIVIGGHTVEFKSDAIKIGCTTVSKETVNEIYKRLNASS